MSLQSVWRRKASTRVVARLRRTYEVFGDGKHAFNGHVMVAVCNSGWTALCMSTPSAWESVEEHPRPVDVPVVYSFNHESITCGDCRLCLKCTKDTWPISRARIA